MTENYYQFTFQTTDLERMRIFSNLFTEAIKKLLI